MPAPPSDTCLGKRSAPLIWQPMLALGFGLFDHAPELARQTDWRHVRRTEATRWRANFIDAAQSYFGTAGPAFVEAFITDRDTSVAKARGLIDAFAEQHATGADGQVQRVARTFGLLAAAGELAIAYGVLPWTPRRGSTSREPMLC